MGLSISAFTDDKLVIRAPFAPNTNDKQTAFAGSLYSAMVLAGWMYVTGRLKKEGLDAEAVASGAEIKYLKPVTSDFEAECRLPEPSDWEKFVTRLQKRKNCKIKLPVTIEAGGELKVQLTGEYHAWMRSLRPFED